MFRPNCLSRRALSRRAAGAGVALVATLTASLAVTAGVGTADTVGTPDPITRAKIGLGATPAPTVAAPGPLTGLVEGSNFHIHTDGNGGQVFAVAARLCRAGLAIVDSAGFSPTQSGDCIPTPFVAGSDDSFVQVGSAPPNAVVDLDFRVGTGTKTFTWNAGASTATITCDAANPCAVWVDHSVPVGSSPDGSGHIFKHWDVTYAGTPGAPAVTATAGNTTGTVNWTPPANTGNAPITNYIVTLTGGPSTPASPVTVPGTATSQAFTGLSNFSTYTATVQAKNTAADGTTNFTSAASAPATFTPGPNGPTNVTGAPGDQKVDLTWTAPTPTPDEYEVTVSPDPATPPTVRLTGSSVPTFTFTGLTNGTIYTFTVRARYGTNFSSPSAPSAGIAPNAQFLSQTIIVTRPQGALILTQVCGAKGTTTTGTAPTLPGGAPDPNFVAGTGGIGEYPYPPNFTPNYPTNCNVNLGNATLIGTGPGANQFFDAKGDISQVTVTDFRDSDPGWTVNGAMSAFTGVTPSNTFGGNQLGWTPAATGAAPFTDGSGNTYAQTVAAGAKVDPNTVDPNGLGTSKRLASAAANQGQGRARLDAALDLWIPVNAKADTYRGTLTITAV